MFKSSWTSLATATVIIFSIGCSSKKNASSETDAQKDLPYCAPASRSGGSGLSTGTGRSFSIDPRNSLNDPSLFPTSSSVGQGASNYSLNHLSGNGTLLGSYVDVRSGLCDLDYGAYNAQNNFNYGHDDPRFREVMSYRYGDEYRASLARSGSLLPAQPIWVIANCPIQDNAYYSQGRDGSGNIVDFVCLGSSSTVSTASFSDDGQVTIHELQHAHTQHAYSDVYGLGHFGFDEAGALNEGLSDAVALMMTRHEVASSFDPYLFSGWALGSLFGPGSDYSRGARRCPTYDSSYPNCTGFSADPILGFSSEGNRISFAYPDGFGWPYAGVVSPPAKVKNAFVFGGPPQEVHQAATIASGTFFEIYEALRERRPSEEALVQDVMLSNLTDSLAGLPKPSESNLSPVTFISFFNALYTKLSLDSRVSSTDLDRVREILRERGLYDFVQVPAGWASFAGIRFSEVRNSKPLDGQLNRGEEGDLWFDIENTAAQTVAGILVEAEILDSGITFAGSEANYGAITDRKAQIRYGKINGSSIVTALSSADSRYNISIGTRYLTTYPMRSDYSETGLRIKISRTATVGPKRIRVRLTPANGATETLEISVEVKS